MAQLAGRAALAGRACGGRWQAHAAHMAAAANQHIHMPWRCEQPATPAHAPVSHRGSWRHDSTQRSPSHWRCSQSIVQQAHPSQRAPPRPLPLLPLFNFAPPCSQNLTRLLPPPAVLCLLAGGWHPRQAGAHHRHCRGPPPPQPQPGVPAGPLHGVLLGPRHWWRGMCGVVSAWILCLQHAMPICNTVCGMYSSGRTSAPRTCCSLLPSLSCSPARRRTPTA
jgi:hypothetical protein